jgi:predicted RNA-binding protein
LEGIAEEKMSYWLCITNEENWNVVKGKNIWGVAQRHKNTILKVKNGDKLLMYLKQEKIGDELKESRISGIFEVQSNVFTSSTKIFKVPKGMKDEMFPLRIKLKPIEIFKQPVEFKPLIPQLKFITNKKKWFGSLMGRAMREISKEDFELIGYLR